MDNLTDWDAEQLERLCSGFNKNAGCIIETSKGLNGRTYSHEDLINGKIRVYLDNGTKLLCREDSLVFKGFID